MIDIHNDKKKLCVPCGGKPNAQYCSKCIDKLSEYALYKKTVTPVVKLFNVCIIIKKYTRFDYCLST